MEENIANWLREGKQSKITPLIKNVIKNFNGSDFEKVIQIIEWTDKNIRHCRDEKEVEKIFATKNTEEVIKRRKHTGCHDVALIFVTLARACNIPSKYIAGLGKETMMGGHCVSEIFINKRWILIDPSNFRVEIFPKRAEFYRKFYIMGIGLDSWDIRIKTLKDWKNRADEINNQIKNIK